MTGIDPSGQCLEDARVAEGLGLYFGAAAGATAVIALAVGATDFLQDPSVQGRIRTVGDCLQRVAARSVPGPIGQIVWERWNEFWARGGSLRPDPNATGPHSTYRRDRTTGRVTHYVQWEPKTNPHPHDPVPWNPVKRYDEVGPAHRNSITGVDVPTPHVHDPSAPGGVRPPDVDEVPSGP